MSDAWEADGGISDAVNWSKLESDFFSSIYDNLGKLLALRCDNFGIIISENSYSSDYQRSSLG